MTESSLETVRLDLVESLRRAVLDKESPLRTAILASVDEKGMPQARVLIIREFDEQDMQLRFFTDARSHKVVDMKASPNVQLVFYDAGQKLHFRMNGTATLHLRSELTNELWGQLPEYGRGDYLSQQPPGASIVDPTEGWNRDTAFGSDNFMVVDVKVHDVDWLKLSASGHKRARLFWRDGQCDGRWVTP